MMRTYHVWLTTVLRRYLVVAADADLSHEDDGGEEQDRGEEEGRLVAQVGQVEHIAVRLQQVDHQPRDGRCYHLVSFVCVRVSCVS